MGGAHPDALRGTPRVDGGLVPVRREVELEDALEPGSEGRLADGAETLGSALPNAFSAGGGVLSAIEDN